MSSPRDVLPKATIRKWVNGEKYLLHELMPELRAAIRYFESGRSNTTACDAEKLVEALRWALEGQIDAARDRLETWEAGIPWPRLKGERL